MAEQPDGGRDLAEESTRRVDWDALQPAVQRADDAADPDSDDTTDPATDDATDSATDDASNDADNETDGLERVDESGAEDATDTEGRVDWSDLQPAVTAAASDDGTAGPDEEPTDGESQGDDEGAGEGDEWDWDTDDMTPPELEGGEIEADPESLVEEDQGPGRDDDVIGPDTAPEPASGGLGMDAPETDEEAPLAVHVEEMVTRLGIVVAIAGLASVVVFPFTEELITTIWDHVLPGSDPVNPRVYHPLELIMTQLKVASLAGLVVALPAFVYESYAFMRPGLYKNERRYYLAAVPTSLVLAVGGVLFAYLLVLPITMDYFQGYTKPTADVAFALGTTFNLILMVMGYLAVVFQIPLFIMLAIMLGVVTREWLEGRRLLFWAAFAGISFTFSAIDPTGVVPVIVAITMIALFEGTLALLRWTGN